MPEGDTIYRTAVNLSRALEGRQIVRGPHRLVGETVERVEARGKHLLMWFDPSGLALHSHMMMRGSWHLYRVGERWRRAKAAARVTLQTDEWVAVCFAAPVCELLTAADVARHPSLAALGPDALAPATDRAEARRRLDLVAGRAIGEVLGDQQVLAGVGNVYRCETLFLCGVSPWATVSALDPAARDAVLATAERLMKDNVDSLRRRTTGSAAQALHVYGRAGRPCLRCGGTISAARQGRQARVTFWCPRCQPATPPTGSLGVPGRAGTPQR